MAFKNRIFSLESLVTFTNVSLKESIKFLYPKIRDLNPDKIKCFENLKDFKITKKQGRQHHAMPT